MTSGTRNQPLLTDRGQKIARIGKRFVFIQLLVCLAASFGSAQIPGGLNETTNTNQGGNNFIVGTVFWPSGKPANTRIRIKLLSQNIGEILASTDDRGQFVFSRLAAGTYSIEIDREDEFEPVTQYVEIDRTRSSVPQTYSVSIRLRERTKYQSKPGVVSVESAGVPRRARAYYDEALKLANAGEIRTAIERLKLAVKEYPSFMDAYNEMGVQHMRLNELEEGLEAIQEALKIKPDGFEPNLNHGIVLFRLGRYADAERVFRGAIKAKEQSALAHYYLGRCLLDLEKYEDAESELRLALKFGGREMNEAHRMLAKTFIAKGEDQRAIDELNIYLKLVPNAPDAGKLREIIRQLKSSRQ
jgi:tetratricopeptide (TPR) repeat protein